MRKPTRYIWKREGKRGLDTRRYMAANANRSNPKKKEGSEKSGGLERMSNQTSQLRCSRKLVVPSEDL